MDAEAFFQVTPKPKTPFLATNRKIIWIVPAILILTAVAGYTYFSETAAAQATDGSAAQTAVVERGDLVVSTSGTGTLIANSDATFGFETSGQVTDVYVKVGDQVEAGQVLAQLDDTLAQMDYAEAQQALAELHSAASIATVQKEIATAQDTASQAHQVARLFEQPGRGRSPGQCDNRPAEAGRSPGRGKSQPVRCGRSKGEGKSGSRHFLAAKTRSDLDKLQKYLCT